MYQINSKHEIGSQPHPEFEIGNIISFRTVFLVCITLAVIVLAVYWQVGNHMFIVFDDGGYVTANDNVLSGMTGENIIWAFTSFDEGNWHPITWLSHMADVQFYGTNPRGHHFTSVAIHILSSLLLLILLFRLTCSLLKSSFVAALFALHPLHVESVAWVAERKDVLSALFWFLSLIMFSEYVAKKRHVAYILSLSFFVLGLMSKPMLVTLPIIMLLMDYWPYKRYQYDKMEQMPWVHLDKTIPLIKEKLPFFVCSLLSGVITVYAQNIGGALKTLENVSIGFRIENALIAYVKYIYKTFWPLELAVFYPLPTAFPLWQIIGSVTLLILVSIVTIRGMRNYPYLFVGWFWFLITLLPVIGLIQVGMQSMADRYTYIPLIGLFIMIAWGVPHFSNFMRIRERLLVLSASLVIIISAVLTWNQIGLWHDGISLFQHAILHTTDNFVAHNALGATLERKGELGAAIKEFEEALRIRPNDEYTHYNLGNVLAEINYLDAAINEYEETLRINPNNENAHNNLGFALFRKGNLNAAIREYELALQIKPKHEHARKNLELVLIKKNQNSVKKE
jgi:protein O-mannosyl-transferase